MTSNTRKPKKVDSPKNPTPYKNKYIKSARPHGYFARFIRSALRKQKGT